MKICEIFQFCMGLRPFTSSIVLSGPEANASDLLEHTTIAKTLHFSFCRGCFYVGLRCDVRSRVAVFSRNTGLALSNHSFLAEKCEGIGDGAGSVSFVF